MKFSQNFVKFSSRKRAKIHKNHQKCFKSCRNEQDEWSILTTNWSLGLPVPPRSLGDHLSSCALVRQPSRTRLLRRSRPRKGHPRKSPLESRKAIPRRMPHDTPIPECRFFQFSNWKCKIPVTLWKYTSISNIKIISAAFMSKLSHTTKYVLVYIFG